MIDLKMVVQVTPDNHDSDDIWWEDKTGKRYGYGYRSKKTGEFGLIKCPSCGKENYALNVSLGVCTWCEFKVIEEK